MLCFQALILAHNHTGVRPIALSVPQDDRLADGDVLSREGADRVGVESRFGDVKGDLAKRPSLAR